MTWAVAARLLPPLSGLIFIVTAMPILSLAEFGRYTLIFTIASQIIFLNKSLILNPMIKFAAEPGGFERVSHVGFWSAGVLQFGLLLILALVGKTGSDVLRLQPGDLLWAGAIPLAFWVRDWGFCVQQTLYRTGRLFWIELIYWGGSAGGYFWLWSRSAATATDVLTVNLAAACLSTVLTFAFWPQGVPLIPSIDLEAARRVIRFGLFSLGLGLAASLLAGADVLILGTIYNPELVGIYGGAKRIYSVITALISTTGLLVIPYVSRLAAEERTADARALFEKAVAYLVVGIGLLTLLGWLFSGLFYRLIMPSSYLDSAPIFRLLLLGAPFEALFMVTASILYGLGMVRETLVTSTIGLVALVLLLFPAAYYFGLTGAALAQVTTIALLGLMMTWRAGKAVGATFAGSVQRGLVGLAGLAHLLRLR